MTKEEQRINTLENIIKTLEQTQENNFQEQIKLYGLINYTRTQYLPQLSENITKKEEYKDIFFNYTSLESMIIDLLEVIEAQTIHNIEQTRNEHKTEIKQLINQLLQILHSILENKNKQLTGQISQEEYTTRNNQLNQEIFNKQNQYYQLIYDEKSDIRIK